MARSKPQRKRQAQSSRASKARSRGSAVSDRAFKVLAAMRDGESLSRAARNHGVTIRTVKRYVGSALVQDRPGGRIRATKSDQLTRYLQIPGPNGPRDIAVRGSKTASKFASYKASINRLLRGDRNAMSKWHCKKIAGIELVTDPKILVEQARKEILPYSLYRSFAGGAN
jgi:DNA-binding CsgD family transcriptional regulator